MPFCHLKIKVPKLDRRYPIQLQTLGDHIRKKRLDLGLLQKEVAGQLGADTASVHHWETGRHEPRLSFIPRILAFLGYDPRPAETSFGRRLWRARTARGLSIQGLAGLLGIDTSTVWKWEDERHRPIARLRRRLDQFFGLREARE